MFRTLLLLIAVKASIACAHSWTECTDYDPPSFDSASLGNFDRARCSGYSRGFARQFAAGFGIDTGYNHERPECLQTQYIESDYSNDIPMATYRPGQVIYISHPSKNHVADVCTNRFIPSSSFELLMSSQPGAESYDISLPMVGGEHVNGNIDKLGYQRCFNFCENPDKSHCITAWTIPADAVDGRHSFHWKWTFNPLETYSNCFDAYISASSDMSSNSSESGSLLSEDITDSPVTGVPTPAATTPASTQTDPPATSTAPPATSAPTTTPVTDTPSPTTALPPAVPDVISSAASALVSPLSQLRSYMINISAIINVTISEMATTARSLRM
jgi:hypothetical protein